MKIKLRSLWLAFVFFAGFQTFCQAQMTVTNQSSCPIYVVAVQAEMITRQAPCNLCNASSLPTVSIQPGASFNFTRDLSCGRHFWSVVAWGTNMVALTSSSWNPALQNMCSFDVFNATCSAGGSGLTATWLQSGAGPVQVVIN